MAQRGRKEERKKPPHPTDGVERTDSLRLNIACVLSGVRNDGNGPCLDLGDE